MASGGQKRLDSRSSIVSAIAIPGRSRPPSILRNSNYRQLIEETPLAQPPQVFGVTLTVPDAVEAFGRVQHAPTAPTHKHPVSTNSLGEKMAASLHFATLLDVLHAKSEVPAIRSVDSRKPLTHSVLRRFIAESQLPVPQLSTLSRVGVLLSEGPELASCLLTVMATCCVVPINYHLTNAEVIAELTFLNACACIIERSRINDAIVQLLSEQGIYVVYLTPDITNAGIFSLSLNPDSDLLAIETPISKRASLLSKPAIRPVTSQQSIQMIRSYPSLQTMRGMSPTSKNSLSQNPVGLRSKQSISGISENSGGLVGYFFDNAGPQRADLAGPDDVAMILRTSGTSGNKKTVPYTLKTLIVGARCVADTWALEAGKDINLNMMPLYHVGGIVRNLLAPIVSNSTVIITSGFDGQAFWDILETYSPTWYYAVPTMHMAILDQGDALLAQGRHKKGKGMQTPIRMIANAGGGLPHSLAVRLREMFQDSTVLPSYGMTECMPIASPPIGYKLEKPGCSGIACGPEIAIMDMNGKHLTPNEFGRIMVRGWPVFAGYENDPKANESSFSKDGFFDTGDMGHLDTEGYLFVTGRSKEIINRGGETISPVEIEDAVLTHPKIANCLAFSVPHDTLQETIGVVIVTKPNSTRVGIAELQKFIAPKLHPTKWPQLIVFMDDLPKNMTNKPLRIKLANRLDLQEITDTTPASKRIFEAQCPQKGAAITEPIFCRHAKEIKIDELQTVLDAMPGKKDVFVFKESDNAGETKLAVMLSGQNVSEWFVINYLSNKIHEYQIPSSIVVVPQVPKDMRGGIDEVAVRTLFEESMQEVLTILERKTCELFMEVLGLKKLPKKEADFFEIGGSSMAVGKIVALIRTRYGLKLKPMILIKNRTAKTVAAALSENLEFMEKLSGETSSETQKNEFIAPEVQSKSPVSFIALLVQILPMYPLWGSYYLRWWIVDQIQSVFSRGIFSTTQYTKLIYMRIMGAKIGKNVQMAPDCVIREYDLIEVQDNCIVAASALRPFTMDPGLMVLKPIVLENGAVVNRKCTIAAGSTLPANTVLPPLSSSHELLESNQKYRIFAATGPTNPNLFFLLTVAWPIILVVELFGQIPWIGVIYWLLTFPFFPPEDRSFSNLERFPQLVLHQSEKYRIGIFVLAAVAKLVICPWFKLSAVIFVKRCIIGKFVPEQKIQTQWRLTKSYIMYNICGLGGLCGVYNLLGRHYEGISIIYRILGAKIGKRVYWPGQPMQISEHDLFEVGDDVVFGSRSILQFSDAVESKKIVIEAGAMLADRSVVLPGVMICKNATIGSGSLLRKNGYYPTGSTWIGGKDGDAVLWEEGTPESEEAPTLKPFGKAFYFKNATFTVLSQPFILFYNVIFNIYAGVVWAIVPLTGILAAGGMYKYMLYHNQPTTDQEFSVGAVFIIAIVIASIAADSLAFVVSILSKWIILRKLTPGSYDWDKSSYCQRWQVFLTLQHCLGVPRDRIRGSEYLVQYFRALGCSIGEHVCLYPTGGDPMMTEPDLLTIGDHSVVERASLICHINSKGKFALNKLKVGNWCALANDSRLLSGAEMSDGSRLLEHTLIIGGEVVDAGAVMQGWPAEEVKLTIEGKKLSKMGSMLSLKGQQQILPNIQAILNGVGFMPDKSIRKLWLRSNLEAFGTFDY
ncbi:hypothetical protein HK100_002569 [Physocladia obscura]|uniref:Carrier domain-containing protein n=1 Tax=Physocladia obscura TaxID=109957 RepID=A0AAD5TAL2_9FUNG|nr:hypothetical protein HK100_002569 [Physocladia obscura]